MMFLIVQVLLMIKELFGPLVYFTMKVVYAEQRAEEFFKGQYYLLIFCFVWALSNTHLVILTVMNMRIQLSDICVSVMEEKEI